MKKIAVVFEENIFDQKGAFRAKLERVRHLRAQEGLQVDVWCIQVRYTWIERLLLGRRTVSGIPEKVVGKQDEIIFDGVPFHMLWLDYSILDHFLFFKLKLRPLLYPRFLQKRSALFRQYDLLSAHSFEGGYLALAAQKRYGIPYCVSWHGSDVHTKPFKYPCIRPLTAEVMAGARHNFFVSKGLLAISDQIGPGVKSVLYNGCSEAFCRFEAPRRALLRTSYQVDGVTVVGFAGNLEEVKNVSVLPALFARIREELDTPVAFWVIGDGRLRRQIESQMQVPCRFWGNVPAGQMPEYLNAMDLLVLPSKNEGLPLILLEAIRCGCKAMASEVGGIPEVLGPAYCVPPGDGFVERFARLAVETLRSPEVQQVPEEMSWAVSAAREAEVYRSI